MDYTLAQYKQPAFDQLAFDGAKAKLVEQKGYPPEVLDFEYDHTMWTRGLIIDTQRGNFLKIDRHKYVRVAYHGFERMSSVTRKLLYSRTFNKVMSFSEKHFVNMDTLFQFVDAHLFALLIDLKDNAEYDVLDFKTYEEIYRDIRECVDLCHRDGVIKDEVAINPDKYLIYDKGMLPMLKRFKDEGVKVFLLTNSQWEYTVTVMNYLFHGRRVDDEEQKKNEWLDLFDLVVVFACKPAYMLDPYLNLFRVETRDGSLLNTDGVYEIEALNPNGATKFLEMGKVFQGGNWMHLQAMLESEAGEEILYVGDHLYSDVLRSKRTLGWRSAFVMPELEDEMRVYAENTDLASSIVSLRKLRDELGLYGEELRRKRVAGDDETGKVLAELDEDDKTIKGKLTELAEQWHYAHHPVWGAMFNAGYQDSRFAFFVANYACLYTSKASNLGLCTSNRSFRTSAEGLPHDKLIESADSNYVEYDVWEDETVESS
jgi:5'-nucleotidase